MLRELESGLSVSRRLSRHCGSGEKKTTREKNYKGPQVPESSWSQRGARSGVRLDVLALSIDGTASRHARCPLNSSRITASRHAISARQQLMQRIDG